jgi:hypothetical protein
MSVESDITVDTPLRRAVLVVECKFALDTSATAAARVRRRLLSGGYLDVSADSYFMLVLPSTLHLWKPGSAPDALPGFSADATPVLQAYLGRIADQSRWPGAECVELAVAAWLGDLAVSIRKPGTSEAERMLVDAGLYDLMKDGTVRREVTS